MADASTWMPFYVGDYLADTMRLTTEQHGAYVLLLLDYWRSGPLPDDDRQLALIVRLPAKEWKNRIAPAVRRFFHTGDDGLLHQKRADREMSKAGAISNARAEAGRSGAAKRWQTNGKQMANAIAEPIAEPSISHKQNDAPLPPPLPEKETTLRVVQKPANRKTQVRPDWEPDADGIAYAKARGLTVADVAHFRDHYRSQGKAMVDWDLTWKNWCRNAPKFGATPLLGLVSTKGVSV